MGEPIWESGCTKHFHPSAVTAEDTPSCTMDFYKQFFPYTVTAVFIFCFRILKCLIYPLVSGVFCQDEII